MRRVVASTVARVAARHRARDGIAYVSRVARLGARAHASRLCGVVPSTAAAGESSSRVVARAASGASASASDRARTDDENARRRGAVVVAARGRPKRGGRGGGGGRGGAGRARAPRECVDFDEDRPKRRPKRTISREVNDRESFVVADVGGSDGFEDYVDVLDEREDEGEDGTLGERALELASQGRGANVKHVEFVQACVDLKGCPKPTLPEIAFIGRSNVGKSSLVNMLTNRKSLAKTSKNPGKTQTINHYRMTTGDGKFYLVDLPGYGFANAPEHLREKWAEFTREYLLKRETLITVMLLVDSTVKPQRLDLECLDWLGEAGVPVTVVFTKVDKRRKIKAGKRANPAENIERFCRDASEHWDELPPTLYTSAETGEGKREVLNHIATLRQFFKKPLDESALGDGVRTMDDDDDDETDDFLARARDEAAADDDDWNE